MRNQETKTSHTDVFPAIAKFIGDAYFEEEIQDLPNDVQQIWELFLETEEANNLDKRLKMLRSLKTIRSLAKCLEPFSKKEVELACKEHGYV